MVWSAESWQETDELKDDLEIKGFTPEIGRIYNANTTKDATNYPTII